MSNLSAAFGHCDDAGWDTTRMNNIAQHFSTAWLELYLKGDDSKAAYLDLITNANESVYSVGEDGEFTDEHTYLAGLEDRLFEGLMFEYLRAG